MAGTGFLSGILRPGAPPSAVRIRHLNHSFGEGDSSKQVLFDIELELAPGDKFYLIREGSVDVYIGDGIESRHVRSMGEGEFFGEIALLTDQPRTATVIAKEHVTLYALSKADFKATLEASSSFGEQLRKVFFLRQ
jgi:CRP-like cAMP-binding protein